MDIRRARLGRCQRVRALVTERAMLQSACWQWVAGSLQGSRARSQGMKSNGPPKYGNLFRLAPSRYEAPAATFQPGQVSNSCEGLRRGRGKPRGMGGVDELHSRFERAGAVSRDSREPMVTAAQAVEGSDVVLQVAGLRKSFRSGGTELTVLAGVNLEVHAGEMVAIVGPSGAGKSTLLHLLAALDTPTGGTVYFRGTPLETLAETQLAEFRNRQVGFVWQRHHLLPDFTAEENAAMPLLVGGASRSKALEAARGWLDEVGLSGRHQHRAGELSGGEQQRVAIARALVTRPVLLLADEPTGDLDAQNADAVFHLLLRLHRTHGLTSILATHNLSLARRASRVLRLAHGVLVPGPFPEGELG